MMLMQTTKLGHSYGTREVLKNIELEIHTGDRIGLVGRNGEGKSTLLRLLAALEQPETGCVAPYGTIAYVPQSLEEVEELTVAAWLATQQADITRHAAKELGLRDHIWELPIAQLSGGEQTKIALLAALSHQPDLLLLDEPTNHLDLDAVQLLEKKLRSAKVSLVVISHDRRFLDEVTNQTWALKDCAVTCYPGNYSQYAAWVAAEEERLQHNYTEYVKEKDRLADAIERKRQWAAKGEKGRVATDSFARCLKGGDKKTAANMYSKAKALERRMEKLEPAEKPEQKLVAKVRFLDITTTERPVLLRGEGVQFRYGERLILDKLDFEVSKDDRIALVGPNGTGKSTLLKLLTQQLTLEQGNIRVTPSATLGYFDQVFDSLNLNSSLLDDLLYLPNMDNTTARLFLGSFLFRGDDVFRKLSTLSYGERVRYVFVKLILCRSNTLILDEPSNHLDLVTREKLEEALEEYPGAMIIASHDRYFLEKMSNKVWEIRDGKLIVHPYGFKQYWEQRNKPAVEPNKKQQRQNLRDELLLLETRLSQLSFELGIITDAVQKQELDSEFISLSRQANQIRAQLR
ncbi:ribosomal protection-like ABC-F family protein [Tumebacillus permanentifrigoris]|uniref:Macrolide transport system ATP-binding/permease protein n=1 Tax=Tumebacillus permanentifrigoris TaxID=378543 RepID=A0A316E170_9BACL|nr:ABC-F type ribosomal protection protein [Tumebacillus permanentifrigoris]PWK16560.1 macrolide transport system ATP-binding/permease protein [Tumebacillus permanentifrigoris]